MTDSDVNVWQVLAHSQATGPEWKKVIGYADYEWSHRGRVRSLDRRDSRGRSVYGRVMQTRLNNSGYVQVNVVNDAGEKETVLLHRMILRAHALDGGEFPPGTESLHGPGGQLDNRWPENLRVDTPIANVIERSAANPPAPKPEKLCIVCSEPFTTQGRRCRPCRMTIAAEGANLLASGAGLDEAAEHLGYPPVALFKLAVQHGGLRLTVTPSEPTIRHAESRLRRLRSVLIGRKASRRDSDGA